MMVASKLGTALATGALLAAAVVSQALATEPAQEATQATQASNTAAAASPAATAASSTSKASAGAAKSSPDTKTPDSGLSAAQIKEARDDGYRPVTRNHVTIYCKSEMQVDSSFPIRICYTAERLKARLQSH